MIKKTYIILIFIIILLGCSSLPKISNVYMLNNEQNKIDFLSKNDSVTLVTIFNSNNKLHKYKLKTQIISSKNKNTNQVKSINNDTIKQLLYLSTSILKDTFVIKTFIYKNNSNLQNIDSNTILLPFQKKPKEIIANPLPFKFPTDSVRLLNVRYLDDNNFPVIKLSINHKIGVKFAIQNWYSKPITNSKLLIESSNDIFTDKEYIKMDSIMPQMAISKRFFNITIQSINKKSFINIYILDNNNNNKVLLKEIKINNYE